MAWVFTIPICALLGWLANQVAFWIAIAAWIGDHFGDDLVLEEGALYQSLRRMEEREWTAGQWGVSENNRRARFYRLTADGRLVSDVQPLARLNVTCIAASNVPKPSSLLSTSQRGFAASSGSYFSSSAAIASPSMSAAFA